MSNYSKVLEAGKLFMKVSNQEEAHFFLIIKPVNKGGYTLTSTMSQEELNNILTTIIKNAKEKTSDNPSEEQIVISILDLFSNGTLEIE